MSAQLYSADELMAKAGCRSMREYRAWLRKQGVRFIDAPGGPIVPHESLLAVIGLQQAQNSQPAEYDPATTI